MPTTIHHPRAFLNWQARVLLAREAHLYRASHDGRGNWTVTRPGSYKDKPVHFPADDAISPALTQGITTGEQVPELAPSPLSAKAMTPAEQHAAEVRSSYVNLSA